MAFILSPAHYTILVLYGVGIVELQLESTSALVLLLFVIPLAFTLSGFLLWIMYSLNGQSDVNSHPSILTVMSLTATIAQLRARKQRYKLKMFERLYYILLLSIFIIAIFFVVSSMSFSGRLAEGMYSFLSKTQSTSMTYNWYYRLRSKILAGSMVVAGWLARIAVLGCFRFYRLPLAAFSQ